MPENMPVVTYPVEPLLRGIAIEGYRSLAETESACLAPLTKINLLAGPNNCGKSNFLCAAQWILTGSSMFPHRVPSLSPLDTTAGSGPLALPRFSIAIPATVDALDTLSYRRATLTRSQRASQLEDNLDELLSALLSEPFTRPGSDGLIWFDYHCVPEQGLRPADGRPYWIAHPDPAQIEMISRETLDRLNGIGHRLRRASGGRPADIYDRTVIGPFDPLGLVQQVRTIEAFRQMTAISEPNVPGPLNLTDSGQGLLVALNELANPRPENDLADRAKFEQIARFLGELIDDSTTALSVAHDLTTMVVRRDGHPSMPLENLGTGIHQLIILISAATLIEDSLVCLEEPEIHLHPVLQRRLLRYLGEETTNQYLIATHSAHLLDTARGSVFRVQLDPRHGTCAAYVSGPTEHAQICADLGYLPSDLVQANSIIWVEGPSDRIYLAHWIAEMDPDLVEGLHFSIMFYGGKLLSHLSADDAVDQFISLRRLNRHVAILIDSDKTKPTARINPTKQRVKKELEGDKSASLAWITDGYTIENYVPDAILTAAVAEVHPKKSLNLQGKWTNPLPSGENFDKTAIARAACERWSAESLWQDKELKARVRGIVDFILRANQAPDHA